MYDRYNRRRDRHNARRVKRMGVETLISASCTLTTAAAIAVVTITAGVVEAGLRGGGHSGHAAVIV